ncbi:MAG: hypothetical protein WCQ95_06290 [Bacteroidota bacterium]
MDAFIVIYGYLTIKFLRDDLMVYTFPAFDRSVPPLFGMALPLFGGVKHNSGIGGFYKNS